MGLTEAAIVIHAEATEQQLIDRARAALDNSHWVVGQCASEWTQRYAKGRTDADFGNLVGLERDQVCQRRKVWETFSDTYHTYPHLSWSHFYAATSWDDAPECLQWANEISASVREMVEYRKRGQAKDDPQGEEEPHFENDPEINFGIIVAGDTCNTSQVVDHKADCASDNGAQGACKVHASGIDKPDRIERETPVTRNPEVKRLPDFEDSLKAIQKLSEQFEEHGANDQLESLAKFHEVRAFKIRKRLEGQA